METPELQCEEKEFTELIKKASLFTVDKEVKDEKLVDFSVS